MKRAIVCLSAWLVLALGVAHGVPSRPLYVPPDPPKAPPLLVLSGTTWIGRLYTEGEQVTFHADGSLTYGSTVKGGGTPGVWRLTGNQLFFEINQWSEYQTVVNGDVISGNGANKSGQKCQPFLKRVHTDLTQKALAR